MVKKNMQADVFSVIIFNLDDSVTFLMKGEL